MSLVLTRMLGDSHILQATRVFAVVFIMCDVFRAPVNYLPTPGPDRVKDGLPVFLSQHLCSLVSAGLAFVQSTRKDGCAR